MARFTMLAVFALLFTPVLTEAGMFDDFVNKQKKAAEDTAKDVTDDVTTDVTEKTLNSIPSVQEKDAGEGQQKAAMIQTPGAGTAASTDESTDGTSPTPANITRAILHYAPEMIDNEANLKQVVRILYPEEAEWAYNEFEWHKRKDEFKQNILREAKNAPVSFEIRPWPEDYHNNSMVVMQLGQYDFNQNAFSIAEFTLKSVLRNQMLDRPFFTVAGRKLDSIRWLPMAPQAAEKLLNGNGGLGTAGRILYSRFTYTITGVNKEMHFRGNNPRNWDPEIAIDGIDLYVKQVEGKGKSADDFKYVSTLDMSKP